MTYVIVFVACGICFALGLWLGSHVTEAEAVERRRRRLGRQQAAGLRAKREAELLDGKVPRVRKAVIKDTRDRGYPSP